MRVASTSVVPVWCLLSGSCLVAVAFAVFAASLRVGVGQPESAAAAGSLSDP
jgi:hypothetical protein